MIENPRFYYVFVGTYGTESDEAIQILLFDSTLGSLKKIGSASGVSNPSYLTVNEDLTRAYAISEVEEGQAVSYEVHATDGKLNEINRIATVGSSPCYVHLSQDEQYLLTANYGGESVSLLGLSKEGAIHSLENVKSYSDSNKKKTSHPHQIKNIANSNKYLVTDLGLDKIYLYELHSKTLELVLINEIAAVPGSGPRHFTVFPEKRMVYVVNEFNSKISVYSYDEKIETLELVQEIGTIPNGFEGDNYGADIHITPSGEYVYASNRGHQSLTTYKVLADGKLETVGCSSTKGEWPRNFAIVPNEEYILTANQNSHSIIVMKIGDQGVPEATGHIYDINSPVCLQIFPMVNPNQYSR